MAIDRDRVSACLDECRHHLTEELLPFWLDRCKDDVNGGFNTQFDKDGNETRDGHLFRTAMKLGTATYLGIATGKNWGPVYLIWPCPGAVKSDQGERVG